MIKSALRTVGIVLIAVSVLGALALTTESLLRGASARSLPAAVIFLACGAVLSAFGAGLIAVGSAGSWRLPDVAHRVLASRVLPFATLVISLGLWAFASTLLTANLVDIGQRGEADWRSFPFAVIVWAVVIIAGAGWFTYAASVAVWAAKRNANPIATRFFGSVLVSFGIFWAALAGVCTAASELPKVGGELWKPGVVVFPLTSIGFGLSCAVIGWLLRRPSLRGS